MPIMPIDTQADGSSLSIPPAYRTKLYTTSYSEHDNVEYPVWSQVLTDLSATRTAVNPWNRHRDPFEDRRNVQSKKIFGLGELRTLPHRPHRVYDSSTISAETVSSASNPPWGGEDRLPRRPRSSSMSSTYTHSTAFRVSEASERCENGIPERPRSPSMSSTNTYNTAFNAFEASDERYHRPQRRPRNSSSSSIDTYNEGARVAEGSKKTNDVKFPLAQCSEIYVDNAVDRGGALGMLHILKGYSLSRERIHQHDNMELVGFGSWQSATLDDRVSAVINDNLESRSLYHRGCPTGHLRVSFRAWYEGLLARSHFSQYEEQPTRTVKSHEALVTSKIDTWDSETAYGSSISSRLATHLDTEEFTEDNRRSATVITTLHEDSSQDDILSDAWHDFDLQAHMSMLAQDHILQEAFLSLRVVPDENHDGADEQPEAETEASNGGLMAHESSSYGGSSKQNSLQPSGNGNGNDGSRNGNDKDDEKDSRHPKQLGVILEQGSCRAVRLFACPWYKRDPDNFPRCANAKIPNISRVGEHLRSASHRVPTHCDQCCQSFLGIQARCEHADLRVSCGSCPGTILRCVFGKVSTIDLEAITAALKANRKEEPAVKWEIIYRELFPGEDIPDPYNEVPLPAVKPKRQKSKRSGHANHLVQKWKANSYHRNSATRGSPVCNLEDDDKLGSAFSLAEKACQADNGYDRNSNIFMPSSTFIPPQSFGFAGTMTTEVPCSLDTQIDANHICDNDLRANDSNQWPTTHFRLPKQDPMWYDNRPTISYDENDLWSSPLFHGETILPQDPLVRQTDNPPGDILQESQSLTQLEELLNGSPQDLWRSQNASVAWAGLADFGCSPDHNNSLHMGGWSNDLYNLPPAPGTVRPTDEFRSRVSDTDWTGLLEEP